MEKRVSTRIPARLSLKYPCSNTFCSGTATNFSENGMFISTEINFPIQSKLEILIPFESELLKIPVKITRIVKTGGVYKGMAVELLNLPKKYLKFLIKLNLCYQH